MVNYTICSNVELANFCADRNLPEITNRSPTALPPTRNELLRALRKADKNPTFRFMDLHPELRNTVYGHLLTLQNAFTCQPNILRTCKQVNSEATGLLYGNNLIEVKIWLDGVYANGQKCGDYNSLKDSDVTKLQWPNFLRRAWFVRLGVGNDVACGEKTRPSKIENVLYSLCEFLGGKHSLRSFELDSKWRKVGDGDEGDEIVVEPVHTYALSFLGSLRTATLNGTQINTAEHLDALSNINLDYLPLVKCDTAKILLRAYSRLKLTTVTCQTETRAQMEAGGLSAAQARTNEFGLRYVRALGKFARRMERRLRLIPHTRDESATYPNGMAEEIKAFVQQVRQTTERYYVPQSIEVLRAALDDLYEADILARIAMRDAKELDDEYGKEEEYDGEDEREVESPKPEGGEQQETALEESEGAVA